MPMALYLARLASQSTRILLKSQTISGHCSILLNAHLITYRSLSSHLKLLKTFHEYFSSPNHYALEQVSSSMFLVPDFINEDEERIMLEEVEKILKRIRYETSHWDDAIHNYRETEHLQWNESNRHIIDRVQKTAFSSNVSLIKLVHILDIAQDGFIKPHVDSVRFCGDTIAGISLMSNSVMRLRLEEDRSVYVDVLLNRRSLYIMTGDARYKYAHEILDNQHSYFRERHIPRERRISVICRNEPQDWSN